MKLTAWLVEAEKTSVQNNEFESKTSKYASSA